jgi:hypothetical protein
VAAVHEQSGGVDVLVTCAGWVMDRLFVEQPRSECWRNESRDRRRSGEITVIRTARFRLRSLVYWNPEKRSAGYGLLTVGFAMLLRMYPASLALLL